MSRYYPPVTVTGNPVNFSAPNGGKLDSVSVQIIPTQDLHGYANPWPAGGGKNNFYYPTNFNATGSYGLVYKYDKDTETFSITGTNTKTSAYIALFLKASDGTATPSLTVGQTCYVYHNLPTGTYMNLTYLDGNGVTKAFSIIGGVAGTGDYVQRSFIVPNDYASFSQLQIGIYGSATQINKTDIHIALGTDSAFTEWTPYSNICPISGLTGLSVYVSPTQDPDDATVYNVDWTSEAGTVYGGTVDVVTGVLTVTWVSVDLGTLNFSVWNRNANMDCFSTGVPIRNKTSSSENIPALSSIFTPSNYNATWKPWDMSYTNANGQVVLMTPHELYADATEFKTAMSGVQLVYELATPLTYQLTPKQIAALIDQNYIWSSNNETISVVYALLVPGSDKYTLIVNGVDIADFVERDSYRTTLYPVFSEAVQTLDGVGHTALLRKKGELSARFNPRTAADTAIICAALLNAPCEVQYHCLQRNADVTALMTIDSVSALYLSRCLYCRQKWNDIDSITLTEL